MPQLDKLTFTSQVFWFFLLFIFLYYSMIQMTLLRLKLVLGLKRFFFQADKTNSFYELSKSLKVSSRYDLLFFFDFNNLNQNSNTNSDSNFSFNVLKNNAKSSFLSYYIESAFTLFDSILNSINKLLGSVSSKTTSLYEYNYVLDRKSTL